MFQPKIWSKILKNLFFGSRIQTDGGRIFSLSFSFQGGPKVSLPLNSISQVNGVVPFSGNRDPHMGNRKQDTPFGKPGPAFSVDIWRIKVKNDDSADMVSHDIRRKKDFEDSTLLSL